MAGDIPEAVAAFEELLADRLRLLGKYHEEVGHTRDELEHWRAKG